MKACQVEGCNKPQRYVEKEGSHVTVRLCNHHRPNAKPSTVWVESDIGTVVPQDHTS